MLGFQLSDKCVFYFISVISKINWKNIDTVGSSYNKSHTKNRMLFRKNYVLYCYLSITIGCEFILF